MDTGRNPDMRSHCIRHLTSHTDTIGGINMSFKDPEGFQDPEDPTTDSEDHTLNLLS